MQINRWMCRFLLQAIKKIKRLPFNRDQSTVSTLQREITFYPSSFLDQKKKKGATSTWEKSCWIKQQRNKIVRQSLQLLHGSFQPPHKEAYSINHVQTHATCATVTFSVDSFFAVCPGVVWKPWEITDGAVLTGTRERSISMHSTSLNEIFKSLKMHVTITPFTIFYHSMTLPDIHITYVFFFVSLVLFYIFISDCHCCSSPSAYDS